MIMFPGNEDCLAQGQVDQGVETMSHGVGFMPLHEPLRSVWEGVMADL